MHQGSRIAVDKKEFRPCVTVGQENGQPMAGTYVMRVWEPAAQRGKWFEFNSKSLARSVALSICFKCLSHAMCYKFLRVAEDLCTRETGCCPTASRTRRCKCGATWTRCQACQGGSQSS